MDLVLLLVSFTDFDFKKYIYMYVCFFPGVGTCGFDFWVALPQHSDSAETFTHYLIITHRHKESINASYVDSSGTETSANFVVKFAKVTIGIEPHSGVERSKNKSLHLTSTHQICILSFNYLSSQSSTLFAVHPTNSLGQEYIVNKLFRGNTLVILATESDTDITLEGEAAKLDRPASLTGLVPFESIQMVAKDDVTKLKILSTKRVAIFLGSHKTSTNPDGYAEQLPDASTMGHHFVFYPSFGEIVCTSSSKSAVLKYVCNDGSSEDRTIQHLDSTTFTSSKLHHCMVQSSAPVTCGQYLKATSTGPVKGFASIPPRAQWSTHYTFGAFVNVVYHIQIVIEDGYQNQLNVSGTFAGVVEGHTLTWSSVLRYSGRNKPFTIYIYLD